MLTTYVIRSTENMNAGYSPRGNEMGYRTTRRELKALKSKPSAVGSYFCRGTLELSGVIFTIKASSAEEAAEKAKAGEWDEWDVSGAESINWTINPATVETND